MSALLRPGERNDLTDVGDIAVGHHQRIDDGWCTGTTVVLPPPGTVGGVDVRGGGPATRETDALAATTLVHEVDAVCLTGGSAYGLDAAGGVVAWLAEHRRGYRVGTEVHQVVPIVPTAAIFDLTVGGTFTARPDAAFGRSAAETATTGPVAQGSVGAGTGARAGSLKGGVGSASAVTAAGVVVGALVVVNSAGGVVDPRTGELRGARHGPRGPLAGLRRPSPEEISAFADDDAAPQPFNTTLVVVATDARLTKPECVRLAGSAHVGMARAIDPVAGYTDGDVAFGLATGAVDLPAAPGVDPLRPSGERLVPLGDLMAAGADAVTRAVAHAALAATALAGLASYRDTFPSV